MHLTRWRAALVPLTAVFLVGCGDSTTSKTTVDAASGRDGERPDPDGPAQDATPRQDGVSPGRDAGPEPDDTGPVPGDATPPRDAGREMDDDVPPVPAGRLRINEIDCHGRDWIELVNAGDTPADPNGWALTDNPEEPTRLFAFVGEAPIPPGGFLSVRETEGDEAGLEFGIACGGDEITLFAPDGSVAERVEVPEIGDLYTWGRLPDATGDFVRTAPTRDAANVAASAPAPAYFDPLRRTTTEISIPEANVALLFADPRTKVQARLRMFDAEGVSTGWRVVGVRLKGRLGSARDLNAKAALRIDLNWVSADGAIDGLENLTLNNMVQDPSYVHEWATYALFQAVGVPAPRIGYTWVRLNGQDFGLYANVETYDDVFLEQHLPPTAHLYEGLYGQDFDEGIAGQLEVDEGDPEDRSDFEAVRTALDLFASGAEPSLFEATLDRVDWPQVLRFFAVEVFTGHWDGYAPTRNNWYAHFDTGGTLRFLPWGVDQTWGYGLPWHQGGGRLFALCMLDAPCRATYDDALAEVVAAYDTLRLPERIPELMQALRPAIERDPRREFDVPTVEQSQRDTAAFMVARRDEAAALLACLAEGDDPDGDGAICDGDCAPDNGTVYPGAPELCGDGLDNDCNGRLDDRPECPDCVEVFRGPHRYLFCPYPRTYAEAGARCADQGSAPVHIGGQVENDWLWGNALALYYQWWWLGASSLATDDGTYLWSDGRSLDFAAWSEGQPDGGGGGERCAHFWEWGPFWNDLNCDAALGTLCEDPCVPGTDEDGDGFDRCDVDCDDGDPLVYPGAPEVCADGLDQSCDGVADEGDGCDCVEVLRGQQRYLFCSRPRTWDEARAHCQALGMDLALVDAVGENTFFAAQREVLPIEYLWLGHTDQGQEGDFFGWDGVARATYFAEGQPDNAGGVEHCVHLFPGSAEWNDLDCGVRIGSICEALCPEGQDEDRDGALRCGTDCDDLDRQVRPGGREVCGDGRDNDCSGRVDDDPRCP